MSSKISLCMIVGNVEDYIERCLDSFKPLADEIVVVRAIGNLPPDKTLDIARDKYSAITAEYRNAPGHEGWPHVDNFAAARQMSYDIASNDFCFWADSDDLLESGAQYVRELANRAEYPCYIFPYKIFGRGLVVPRERMMLRRAGKWRHRVHECFDFTIKPTRGIEDDRVVIVHMPKLSKTGSNDRNLRILESTPKEEMTAGLLYHLHGEYMGKRMLVESVDTAKKALADPELGRAEKYEIFLNLATLTDHDLNVRKQYLLQAYATDPTRREAIALLCSTSMDLGQNEDALAYSRHMMATPRPLNEYWNSRVDVYDWIGADVAQQALRANGKWIEADELRAGTLQAAGGARVCLIHATRGRPQQAAQARKLWLSLAEKPDQVEHMFIYDEDDEASGCLQRMHSFCIPKGGGCVAAWNTGCFYTDAPIFVQMSDDWQPPPMWDKLIFERIPDVNKPYVLAVSDGHRKDDLLCMVICTRAYWMQDFFMFHPWFTGVYSDNWATRIAYERNQVIDAKDIVFEHLHPFFTGKPADKTYSEQNSEQRYIEGKAIEEQLEKRADWSTVPGWFNYWPFYRTIAAQINDGDTIAEVGTWLGRSIIFLAQELQRLGKYKVKILAVDSFKGEENQPAHTDTVANHGGSIRQAFESNIDRCGVKDMITVIESDSAEAAKLVPDGSLAFCYIDAAHEYEPVKRDLAAWAPKVSPSGLLAGHDAQHPPVIKAVKEAFGEPKIVGPVWVRP